MDLNLWSLCAIDTSYDLKLPCSRYNVRHVRGFFIHLCKKTDTWGL